MGLVVAADRMRALGPLLDNGLMFLERAPDRSAAARRRFPWRILSNSPGREFLESIRADGAFSEVLASHAAVRIAARPHWPVWLPDVAEVLNQVGDTLEQLCAGHAASTVLYGAEVESVTVEADGTFTAHGTGATPLLNSRYLVVATGADERVAEAAGLAPPGAVVVPSGAILAGDLGPVAAAIDAGRRVVIVGSSHSAFGVAHVLLRDLGPRTANGQLIIGHRGAVPLFFTSAAEARHEGIDPQLDEICPDTGAVNRFNGLRAQAKDLYRHVRDGVERRVRIVHAQEVEPDWAVSDPLLVAAAGYSPRPVRLRFMRPSGPTFTSIELGTCVDDRCRLVTESGRTVPGAYGIGIGYPRMDSSGCGKVGINRFHGPDGADIVRAVLDSGAAASLEESPLDQPASRASAQRWR
jgi:hypothetical protein